MATHSSTIMRNPIRNLLPGQHGLQGLKLEAPTPVRESVQPWVYQDHSWHNSSFELAKGLEVIEYRGPCPALWADMASAFCAAGA